MRRSRRTARLPLLLLIACPLLPLAGCSDTTPQTAFAPLRYDYLPVMRLNVATITTVDNGRPGSVPGDISGQAPTPPDQALLRMAADRLAAAGSTGTATFTIDRASILHLPGGGLDGQMDVHLDVSSPNGQHAGYAEAHVRRSFSQGSSDGDGNADSPANLYALTSQMMKDMNIELEFQIRHHLSDWLVDAGGGQAAVQQQQLGLPTAADAAAPVPVAGAAANAAAAAVPATPAAPAAPATGLPDAIFPTGAPTGADAAVPAPRTLSPQPGYLTLPPGTATSGTATSGTAPSGTTGPDTTSATGNGY